jgi:hypothetical protein
VIFPVLCRPSVSVRSPVRPIALLYRLLMAVAGKSGRDQSLPLSNYCSEGRAS